MPTGVIRGYDMVAQSGYIIESNRTRRHFSAFVGDIASGEETHLRNGQQADFTSYKGSNGTPRACNVRRARRTRTRSSPAIIASQGTAIISHYEPGIGGFATDEATGEDFRFSERVVTPANTVLQEGNQVSFSLYSESRRGIWAKRIVPA